MEDLLISLLLLDVTKRDLKLIAALYLFYLKFVENKGKTVKIRDIATLTGLTSTAVVDSLNDLVNYNVVGRLIRKSALERKIERNFDDKFLQTLKAVSKKDKIHEAINRVGFYVTADESIYVFNPVISSWKYLKWKKVEKALKLLQNTLDNGLVDMMLKNKNTAKNKQDQTIKGISIKACLRAFGDKFKATYSTTYSFNYQIEYSLMKALLKQITLNGLLEMKDYLKFLDWGFAQAKETKKVLQVSSLKFYANDYMANIKNTSEFYYDDNGTLRRRK